MPSKGSSSYLARKAFILLPLALVAQGTREVVVIAHRMIFFCGRHWHRERRHR
jgi:hypothetical protein